MALIFSMVSAQLGCGSASESPTAKESTVNARESQSDNQNLRKKMLIFETYIRLRDGVAPSANLARNRDFLHAYNLSFSQVRDANHAVARRSNAQCKRFIKLYNDVGTQLSFYFGEILKEPPISLQLHKVVNARLQILMFFQRTLFGFIIMNAEAGESGLDHDIRSTCAVTDRFIWTNLLLKSHQNLEILSNNVLGVPSAMAISDEAQSLRELNQEYGRDQLEKKIAWTIGEIIASIALWEKLIFPQLQLALNVVSFTPMGRLITIATGSVYFLGWVAFDRYMREVLPFLRADPVLLKNRPLSNWDQIIKLGEDFLISNVISPPLYFAYVELLSVLRKETAFEFITENSDFLKQAEEDYGSIDSALKNIKEVLNDKKDSNASSSGRDGLLDNVGPR